MYHLKNENKIAKGYLKKKKEIWPYQEDTVEYILALGQCKTEFMEAIKCKGILKDYLKLEK